VVSVSVVVTVAFATATASMVATAISSSVVLAGTAASAVVAPREEGADNHDHPGVEAALLA
jgi:hypothetical protein